MSTYYFAEKVDGARIKPRGFTAACMLGAEGWRSVATGEMVFYGVKYRRADAFEAEAIADIWASLINRSEAARRLVYRKGGMPPGAVPTVFFVAA